MAEISSVKISENLEKFSVCHLDQLATARFTNSPECEKVEKGLNLNEPENFPRIDPYKIPDLVEKIDGKWYAKDSGKSRIFGESSSQPIQIGRDGRFDLFSHIFQLLPDLQGKQRKHNFNALQKYLLNARNFPVPVSEAVSYKILIYFIMFYQIDFEIKNLKNF